MKKPLSRLCLLLFAAMLPARAYPFVNVSPTLLEYTTEPGGVVKGSFTLENQSDHDVRVTMEVKEWWGQQTGLPALEPSKWLKVKARPVFSLKAGARKVVRFVGRVPKDWKGGLAAMLFFSKTELTQAASGPINLQMRHGVPIYVYSRGGDDRISLEVESVAFTMEKDGGDAKLNGVVRVRNDGTVHVRPRGTVEIYDGSRLVDNPQMDWGAPVFPGKQQTYIFRGRGRPWPAGRYTARVRLGYEVIFLPAGAAEKAVEFEVKESGEAVALP